MSYHKSAFGAFAGVVAHMADADGYVPEVGDDAAVFVWPDAAAWADMAAQWYPDRSVADAWETYCRVAQASTDAATQALAQWRAENAA